MARAALLSVLVALLCAAPASAAISPPPHGDEIPPSEELAASGGSLVTALADATWCGQQTSADDVTDQAAIGNTIKVVYARAADQPDRFAQYANVIQADVKAVADAFLAASDDVKTVRFDLGTSCGPTYVDVQSVTLPRNRADYMAMGFTTRVTTLSNDLKPLVAGSPSCVTVTSNGTCTRDFLVYADGFYNNDYTTGVATRRTDDSPGAGNVSNRGGQFAFVLGDGSPDFGYGSSSATTAEHELLHNLGAVQDTAPHSTHAGHCYDEVDVMCYPDGGSAWVSLPAACPTALDSLIDCGNDDYFDPDGSIVGTGGTPIWNVYDSVFLCAADNCGAGGPTISSVPATGTPETTTQPVAPAPAPATPAPVRPATPTTTPRDPLTDLAKVWQTQLKRLFTGGALRIGYRAQQDGTFTARLMLGGRAVAWSSTRARAGRRAYVTLRLSARTRRALAHSKSRLKLRLAFVH